LCEVGNLAADAAGKQLLSVCCEKITAGAPARKCVDGQQVFSCFLMRKATNTANIKAKAGTYEQSKRTTKGRNL
jgi:hypothetical protein